MTLPIVKYPAGLFEGARVRANAKHDLINPRVPKGRLGIVVAPTRNPLLVRVLWEGRRAYHPVDVRRIGA